MQSFYNIKSSEEGSILVVALVILVLLTVIGISASRTTNTELLIAGNEKLHKIAFYSAEAGRGYVARQSSLYGTDNITEGGKLYFPNNSIPSQKYALDSTQSFNGNVEYLGSFSVPRGKGFEAGKFKAHRYKMTCNGYGPSNAESNVETGFYRIGF